MRQFFIFFFIFPCLFASADHNTRGYDFKGKIFSCSNFRHAKDFAENVGGPENYYRYAHCLFHRDLLDEGVKFLEKAYDEGSLLAAVDLYEFYLSEGFTLFFKEETTRRKGFMEKALVYMEYIMTTIRSDPDYPTGDDIEMEKKHPIYLTTLESLVSVLSNLFFIRVSKHIESTDTDLEGVSLIELNRAKTEIENCTNLEYKPGIWDWKMYDFTMRICNIRLKFFTDILPWEEQRVAAALEFCKGQRLSTCEAHNNIELKIYKRFLQQEDDLGKLRKEMREWQKEMLADR